MIGNLKIGVAQINPVMGHLNHNAGLICSALKDCATFDLVVFPELAICGYPPEDLVLKPSFVADCMAVSRNLILEQTERPAFILTTPWAEGGKVYNAALLVENGKIIAKIFKHNLPNYGVFDEWRVFDSAPLPDVVDFHGHRLGILICEDIWFPEGARKLKDQGAQIILSPNGSPYHVTKRTMREDVIRARVSETGLPLLYVNQVGGQDDLVYDGGSMAFDAQGNKIFQAPFNQDYIGPAQGVEKEQENCAAIYDVLKRGLKDYVGKNGFKGVLLGMSGGIDSALSAAIAVDALGPQNVRCVMLPSPFTSQESFEDARACAAALGCSYEELPIETGMKALESTLSLSGLAHENMQSRLRGLILMALSNQTGAMVLTTGNKSEMATGYATLYGDMCGGYNVLKDVYKTQIYALARYRNTLSPVLPERILTKAPTAELRANQTDQDSLPPYDILDTILEGLIERDESVAELTARGYDRTTVLKVNLLLDLAEYKRRQSAPGPKVTVRAFGRDRRYPITNGYRFFIEKA